LDIGSPHKSLSNCTWHHQTTTDLIICTSKSFNKYIKRVSFCEELKQIGLFPTTTKKRQAEEHQREKKDRRARGADIHDKKRTKRKNIGGWRM